MTECEVFISSRSGREIMPLDIGMSAVQKFSDLANSIPGAISTEWSFNDNVDVTIRGRDLLPFIAEHYPERYQTAIKRLYPGGIYTVVCYDMS